MDIEVSLPWPSNIPQLKRLDELLRCGICYEMMSTSMITACSHNYCSLCIRQYLSYKTQCPACFQETTTQHLRNNRLVDEIIGLFSTLRDKVARMNQASKGGVITGYLETNECEGEDTKEDQAAMSSIPSSQATVTTTITSRGTDSTGLEGRIASPNRPSPLKGFLITQRSDRGTNVSRKINLGKNMLSSQGSTPLKGSNNNNSTPLKGSSSSSSSSQTAIKSPLGSLYASQMSTSQSPTTQSACQVASGHFSIFSHSTSTNNEGSGQDGRRVPCPVCGVPVPERNINLHLDACLQRMEKGNDIEIIAETSKRKPLPKLVYSLLSEKQMRQKLKDIGLSFQGNKQALVNRHRRYITLYNAECDVAEPRSVPELLRQVEHEEREKARVASSQSIFTYDRKTAPQIIEKEQKNYMKKNKDHFAQLIADVRRRREEQGKEKDIKRLTAENQTERCEQMLDGSRTDNKYTNQVTLCEYTQSDSRVTKSSETLKLNDNKDENISVLPKKKSYLVINNRANIRKNDDKQGKREILCPADPGTANSVDMDAVQEKSEGKSVGCLADEHSLKPPQESCFGKHTNDAALFGIDDQLPDSIPQSEKQVECSPDFFLNSPSSSEGSGESVSLLQDTEPLLQESEPLLQDSEPLLQDSEPLLQDSEPLLQDSEPLLQDSEPLLHDSEPLLQDSEPLLQDSEPLLHDSEPLLQDSEPLLQDSEPLLQDSEPLLQDSEPLLHDSEPLLQDSEPLLHDSEPLLHDSEPLLQDSEPVGLIKNEFDEELVPSHQPETFPASDIEDREAEVQVLQPSPEVGRRSTRARKTDPHPDRAGRNHDNLDSQLLISNSQGDPEYIPSKLSQAMDSEDLDFEIPQQTRRSNRKRKSNQEVVTSSRRGRKKKRQ